ncbi:hypothetical protein METHPM2_470019 [Pseudomonas sp. PM2]
MVTVPVVPVEAVRTQGRLVSVGSAHRPPPVRDAPLIEATPPLTLPVKVMPHVTAAPKDEGDFTTMVPALVENGPSGETEAALAIDAAPKHRANEVAQTRVFKLFIVFPHMLWRFISPGVMAMIERSR